MGRIGKLRGVFALIIAVIFSLSAAGEEKNLLQNGGFEELTKTGAPAGWHGAWPSKGVSLSKDVTWAGSYSICLTQNENDKGSVDFVQYFPPGTFKPGAAYRLTCYIKTKSIVPDPTAKYPEVRGGGFQIMVCEKKLNYFCPAPLFTGTIPWTVQQFTFTTPKEISATRPYFRVVLRDASGTIWFDDLCLEAVGDS